MRLTPIALFAAVLMSQPVSAAAPKSFDVATKVGRSNVRIRVVLHPQVDGCSAAQSKLIRNKALSLGQAHMRGHLKEAIARSRTEATAAGEFFGVSMLAGCPKDGTAWVAFPAEGKDREVSRYAPELGWSSMMKL